MPNVKMNLQNETSNLVLPVLSAKDYYNVARHPPFVSVVNHSNLLFQLNCIIKLFNSCVYLLNFARVKCAQFIHLQASERFAACQIGGGHR